MSLAVVLVRDDDDEEVDAGLLVGPSAPSCPCEAIWATLPDKAMGNGPRRARLGDA